MKSGTILMIGVLLGLCTPAAAMGQHATNRTASLATGVAYHDVRGEGYMPTIAGRIDQRALGNWLLFEVGATYTPLLTELPLDRTHLLGLDAQVQAQLPLRVVQPYVGIGGGAMIYLTNPDEDGRVAPLSTVSTGVRIPVSPRWARRGDARLQLWERARETNDAFVHGAAGVSLGASRRF